MQLKFPSLSPGDQSLTEKPEDCGYEIAKCRVHT